MLLLIVCVAVGAVGLGVTTAVAMVQERAEVRKSLRSLDGYQIQGVRDQKMLQPFSERMVSPIGKGFTDFARRFTPEGYREQLAKKVMLAGNPAGFEVDRLIVRKALGAISGVLWVPAILFGAHLSGLLAIFGIAVMWGGSFMLPELMVDRAVESRKKEIARSLTDMLDLLVISVEAGLGFDQALDRTAQSMEGPLADECRRLLHEVRIGASRSDALRAMDERTNVPELSSFILALLQADTFGVSISRILRSQAEEMRVHRRLAAQELAQKAPVKMLFPLVICIFPAVFIIILGPALITISKAL
jgi:tight adherence protein C